MDDDDSEKRELRLEVTCFEFHETLPEHDIFFEYNSFYIYDLKKINHNVFVTPF